MAVRKLIVKEPVFRTTLFLFIGSPEEVRAYLKKKWQSHIDDDDDLTDCVMGEAWGTSFSLSKDEGQPERLCIWLQKFDGTVDDLAILQHELLHWILKAMNDSGVFLHTKSEEVFTYMTEYYTRELYKALIKKKWLNLTATNNH